jgi:hypothetical protein
VLSRDVAVHTNESIFPFPNEAFDKDRPVSDRFQLSDDLWIGRIGTDAAHIVLDLGDEFVGEGTLLVKHLKHFTLLNVEHSARRNRGSRAHVNGLTCQTAFTKEVARSQNGNYRLFAVFINDGELHTAFLQINYRICGIAFERTGAWGVELLFDVL